jgi:acetyl-CoA C-acetyltransferase
MAQRVGVVEVAQSVGTESKDNLYEEIYKITKQVLDKAELSIRDVDTVVSAASDTFTGLGCANAYYWDSTAAFLKNGSRQDGESLFSLYYAAMRIMTGHYETALIVGICRGSEHPETDSLTVLFGDPFSQKPLGLCETIAAAFQMRLYMERYGITEEQCAKVAVKNLANALRNPYAHRKRRYTVDDILNSERIADPLTAKQCAPKSDGIVAVLLAAEKKTKQLTKRPVWLRGFGSSMDNFYIGDKDLLGGALRDAASRAYKKADITDPQKEIDLAEICEPYAFQELLWCEQLGICGEGEGGKLIDSGRTQRDGDLPVNPSGGVLANNPYISRGLQRVAEAVLQLKGQAGERQVEKEVKTAIAHGTTGFAGHCHCVAILGV